MNSHYEKIGSQVRCIDDEIPFELPNGWEWCRLGSCINLMSGRDMEPHQYNSNKRGIPYMTGASNFINGELIVNRWTESPITIAPLGSLLITCKGTIGELAFNRIGDIHIARQIMAILGEEKLLSYIRLFLEFKVNELESQANSMIPGISRDVLLSILFPMPPREEQKRITSRFESLSPLIEQYSHLQGNLSILEDNICSDLKKSVLQYAIEGKLVSQDPADEPAIDLLERIKAEKERLFKEKKIKRDKCESVIFRGDDNKYYEQVGVQTCEIEEDICFPESWCVTRLDAICKLSDGEHRSGQGLCLDTKYLRRREKSFLEGGKFVNKDDAIILVDGENSGEVFISPTAGYMGSTFKQLWISSEMYRPYVLNFILLYKDMLRNSKKGAAIPHLNKDVFKNLIIGIPPLEEQKRISVQIDRAIQMLK